MSFRQFMRRAVRPTARPRLAVLASLLLVAASALSGAPPSPPARAAGVAPPSRAAALRRTTVGVFENTINTFYLRYSNDAGPAHATFQYGPVGGDRTCSQNPVYCTTGWFPIAGDWDGDGIDTVGLYHRATGTFFLRNSNTPGPADLVFPYGPSGPEFKWHPLAGDWDGDGVDTVGLYDGWPGSTDSSSRLFFLKNTNAAGPADIVFSYGPTAIHLFPIAGDWDGDGVDTVGLYTQGSGVFFLKNTHSSGHADVSFTYRPAMSEVIPIAGDWNGDGVDTVGVWQPNPMLFNPALGRFHLKDSNAEGAPDYTFTYGPRTTMEFLLPVVGAWEGNQPGQ